jgi:hypothetical protein
MSHYDETTIFAFQSVVDRKIFAASAITFEGQARSEVIIGSS